MEWETGLGRTVDYISNHFPEGVELHKLNLQDLETIKLWYSGMSVYAGEGKTVSFANLNNAKVALKTKQNEIKIAYLKDLTGSDKARIATMYAENDTKIEIQSLADYENAYEKIKNVYNSSETMRMSIMQTIATVNKEKAQQIFIQGK